MRYSSAPHYFKIASRAIKQMRKNQPRDVVENGLMKKGLIVRHMILPSHAKDSMKILDWIASALGRQTYVSVMCQYLPLYKALGFEKGFYQDEGAACEEFIPEFSNTLNLDEI